MIDRGYRPLTDGDAPARRRMRARRDGCSVPGCRGETYDAKPYCMDHLDHLPSVKALSVELAELDRLDSPLLAREVLSWIENNGPTSVAKLAQELRVAKPNMRKCVDAMIERGEVFMSTDKDAQGRVRSFVVSGVGE